MCGSPGWKEYIVLLCACILAASLRSECDNLRLRVGLRPWVT